jgi:hypothetical protein
MGITTHSAGSLVWSVASWHEHRHSICRLLLHPYRLPHLQVDVPASNSGRADGVCRFGLADLSGTAARKLSVSLHSGTRLPRGTSANAVAPRDGVNVQRWKDRAIAVGGVPVTGNPTSHELAPTASYALLEARTIALSAVG